MPLDPARLDAAVRAAAIPGLRPPITPTPLPPEPGPTGAQHVVLADADGVRALATIYDRADALRARRHAAGLRVAGNVGLGPGLVLADEAGSLLGAPLVVEHLATGTPLGGDAPLAPADAQAWLFVLLTLHHLNTDGAGIASSMSTDAAEWWRRVQPAWEACRAAYAAPDYRPLLDALGRLHAVVGARIEAQRDLWREVPRRLCHGDPTTENLLADGPHLMLIHWEGFGLGDPAMEVARAAVVAVLHGQLERAAYDRMLTDYVAGTRDLPDPQLEKRLHVFASVVPMGYACTILAALPGVTDLTERAAALAIVERALDRLEADLGIGVGQPASLLAPLRQPVRAR